MVLSTCSSRICENANRIINRLFNESSDQSKLIKEAIKKYCKNKIVLDLGCGDLKYSIEAKKSGAKQVTAIDIIKPKRSFRGVNFILADAQNTSLSDNSFDVIICIGLVEYVNLERIISELKRILRKRGIILLQIKDSQSIRHSLYKVYCRIKNKSPKGMPYNYRELFTALEDNFKILIEKRTIPKHNVFFILKTK